MDWFIDPARPEATSALRVEFLAYLRRHGDGRSDFAAAEVMLASLLGEPMDAPAWVELDWSGERPVLTVHDVEPRSAVLAVSDPTPARDGLYRVPSRAHGALVSAKRAGGARVSVALPVRRATEESFKSPRVNRNALPAPEEAGADGAFGREPFLRALVVQLAQAVERERGPDSSAALVAQVGADVGNRMEDEYRRARGLVERLTPEQMGDLYVGLKRAIDGDFYVIEASEERIVLGNRRCPFGEVVKHAPTLCRMTSSVFGGIAARNAGAAAVHLDERIAVGDPECRVTVVLRPGADEPPHAHRYEADDVGDPPPRVILAEDVVFLRDPLARVLADAALDVVAHSDSREDLLLKVRSYRPDVVVIDFREADTRAALSTAREIRDAYPDVGVLVLAEHVDVPSAKELLADGSDGVGYVLKDRLNDVAEFVAAVRAVANRRPALDRALLAELTGSFGERNPLADLTARELEVLQLLADGLSNQEIAERLVVTKRAVEKHVKSIFRKLRLPQDEGERRVLAVLTYARWRAHAPGK